ncbi:hypothetical protein [Halorussus halobius]|uniref:hypothetical protein n=1 Tax=Halorussus halobius TaxID=1710537 RepID=UPI0010922BBC|nr:hypothetical protein [Halorussus halobius]
MANSQGDPRVLFVMNLVLSAGFATLVVWGLSVVDALAFEWQSVVALTGILMVVTYLVVR